MQRFIVLLAAAAALSVPAAQAAPAAQGPGGFVVWELRQIGAGRWPQLWTRIHPAQRKHVKQLIYVGCNAQIASNWSFVDIKVTAVKTVRATVPGTTVRNAAARAVTVRMSLRNVDGRTTTEKQTVSVFHVGGVWYSALTAVQYRAYKAGKCLVPSG